MVRATRRSVAQRGAAQGAQTMMAATAQVHRLMRVSGNAADSLALGFSAFDPFAAVSQSRKACMDQLSLRPTS